MRARWAATLVALLATVARAFAGPARAAPSPTITDLHVTNFDPFLNPADATFDPTASTPFNPVGASFDSQGFDFENSFTNHQFPSTVGRVAFVHTYGLCGGMSYAALDTFLAGNGTTTPQGLQTGSAVPGAGLLARPESESLFDYLYKRQRDSLTGDQGYALREMAYMTALPTQSPRSRIRIPVNIPKPPKLAA